MALPDQHSDLKPVYDKDAAVKYVVYNGNQWVSYNDADTLKQKIDWANNLGLGGSLIWASDADNDKYSGQILRSCFQILMGRVSHGRGWEPEEMQARIQGFLLRGRGLQRCNLTGVTGLVVVVLAEVQRTNLVNCTIPQSVLSSTHLQVLLPASGLALRLRLGWFSAQLSRRKM